MLRAIKTEVLYPYPPERVWQVLTNRQALAAWLMENDFEPKVGHKFRFQTQPLPELQQIVDCEVIELDEPRRLSYTWQDRLTDQPSIVTWTLQPVEGGTQLRLEHRQLAVSVTRLPEPIQPSHLQGQFMHESTQLTQTLKPITQNALVSSKPIAAVGLAQIQSNFYSIDKWSYRLNHCLPQILARVI